MITCGVGGACSGVTGSSTFHSQALPLVPTLLVLKTLPSLLFLGVGLRNPPDLILSHTAEKWLTKFLTSDPRKTFYSMTQ